MSVKVGSSWKNPAVTSVKVGGVWKTAATMYVKIAGAWKVTTFCGPPPQPTVAYAGSGTTNNGKFTITNYGASLTYTLTFVSGTNSGASRASDTVTVNAVNSRYSIAASYGAGLVSSPAYVERKAAVQSSYFVPTGPPECLYSPGPISGFCGPGTYYPEGGWGPGEPAGYYCCGTPGYYVYYYENFGPSGYTWSGSDYTNGAGEWYKLT